MDLRLRTTSSGLQDVGTREGLRILVQAYLAWQVDDDPAHIAQFLRAGRRDPDDIARQLRSFMGSTLQVTASNFNLTDLVNTARRRRGSRPSSGSCRPTCTSQVLDTYGIRIVQTGVERFSLPAETLAATVARMRAERETVAAQRTANGLRTAAAIRSDAARDARLIGAQARAGGGRDQGQGPRAGGRDPRRRLRPRPAALYLAAVPRHAGVDGGPEDPHHPAHRRRTFPRPGGRTARWRRRGSPPRTGNSACRRASSRPSPPPAR